MICCSSLLQNQLHLAEKRKIELKRHSAYQNIWAIIKKARCGRRQFYLWVDHGKEDGSLKSDWSLKTEDGLGHPCTPGYTVNSSSMMNHITQNDLGVFFLTSQCRCSPTRMLPPPPQRSWGRWSRRASSSLAAHWSPSENASHHRLWPEVRGVKLQIWTSDTPAPHQKCISHFVMEHNYVVDQQDPPLQPRWQRPPLPWLLLPKEDRWQQLCSISTSFIDRLTEVHMICKLMFETSKYSYNSNALW